MDGDFDVATNCITNLMETPNFTGQRLLVVKKSDNFIHSLVPCIMSAVYYHYSISLKAIKLKVDLHCLRYLRQLTQGHNLTFAEFSLSGLFNYIEHSICHGSKRNGCNWERFKTEKGI